MPPPSIGRFVLDVKKRPRRHHSHWPACCTDVSRNHLLIELPFGQATAMYVRQRDTLKEQAIFRLVKNSLRQCFTWPSCSCSGQMHCYAPLPPLAMCYFQLKHDQDFFHVRPELLRVLVFGCLGPAPWLTETYSSISH